MKRMRKRLLSLLLCFCMVAGLLPVTALAANFPSQFYAALMGISGMGTVSSNLTYTSRNTEAKQVHGMEYAGGVFFTVEGKGSDDGFRELRMYNSDLTNSRTIGEVNKANGGYWIIDTAMDLSGAEPALYGTYNGYALIGSDVVYCSSICKISLTDGKTSNWQTVTGIPETDIIYAMAFNNDGTLYAISADMGDDGGPASLYTIDKASGAATEVGEIKDSSGEQISTNYVQDLAFDYATGTLYWAENAENVLYTVNTTTAAATRQGQVKYGNVARAVQSFCIPYTPSSSAKHMISVFCEGEGKITKDRGSDDGSEAFYMVNNSDNITLNITPDHDGGLRYVKVDGVEVSLDSQDGYTYSASNVTGSHVIEVAFKVSIPATQKDVTWLHYQGEPAKFYTQEITNKFYDLPYMDQEVPREGYVQTLLDENGYPIDGDEIIVPGNYDVRVTHLGTDKYYPMDVTYTDALQLKKCPGTPGRPVVYGKVGCTQGDLATTSALQDYYGTDDKLIDAAHDEIPVTLVWLNPETVYNEVGNFNAKAEIYAADDLDQRLMQCYPLTPGCKIDPDDSLRNTQVIVLPADEASIIRLQTSDASGGTVSGKGVYKNGETVTVTAAVNTNAGYEFKGWQENGSVVSTEATYTFNAEKDRTLTALFEVNEDYRVTLQADPQNGGTVTGGGSYEADNHEATVTATANQGYYFIGWYKAGQEEAVNTNTEHTFTVPEDGATLTAKFGVDYLYQAEQAKETFASAVDNNTLSWAALENAVDTYQAAKDFVTTGDGSTWTDAQDRFQALTTYYNGIDALNLSNQDLSSVDLTKLAIFTGVTELNLSGNKGVTGLTALKDLTQLETLDISNTGVTAPDSLITEDSQDFPGSGTLTAKNLTLASISALAELVSAEGFNTDAVTKWDFTGSTLPDTEDNRADVETIKTTLGEKFSPPTIQTTPDEPEIPDTPVNPGGGGVTTYTVTVEDAENGKVTRSPARAGRGTTVTITTAPDDGYELDKLTVTDARGSELELTDKGNGKYTFRMPASKVTVEAVFTEILPEPLPFIDVRAGAWYYDAVDYVYQKGFMTGTSENAFSPDMTMTRGMIVTILHRMDGAPNVGGRYSFEDVPYDAWYSKAVLWAERRGIVSGYSAEAFGPNDPITREQLAAILCNYSAYKGGDTSARADLSKYSDVSAVSGWAKNALSWANAKGLVNGVTTTTLEPKGAATRAQAATMLQRFCEQYSQNEG